MSLLPYEAVVELECSCVGHPSKEVVAPVKVVERPEAEEVDVHVEAPMSKQDLSILQPAGKNRESVDWMPLQPRIPAAVDWLRHRDKKGVYGIIRGLRASFPPPTHRNQTQG